MHPTLGTIAAHMGKMPPEKARRKFDLYVGAAFAHECHDDFATLLHFNALLATKLREDGTAERIWGAGEP